MPNAPRIDWTPAAIRGLRLWLRYSKADLARALETQWQTVHGWEGGRHRPALMAQRSLDALAEREGYKEAP